MLQIADHPHAFFVHARGMRKKALKQRLLINVEQYYHFFPQVSTSQYSTVDAYKRLFEFASYVCWVQANSVVVSKNMTERYVPKVCVHRGQHVSCQYHASFPKFPLDSIPVCSTPNEYRCCSDADLLVMSSPLTLLVIGWNRIMVFGPYS